MTSPFLSIVAASRNDDHGGNLLIRMQAFITGLAAQCERHEINAGLVLVEWNPPRDRPSLDQALDWSTFSDRLAVRIITVPPVLHDALKGPEKIPLHQFIAKNVGIRRARGDFILSTNIDVLFSNSLMETLSPERLQEDKFYRCDRYDVPSDLPMEAPITDQLVFCAKNVTRIHERDGSRNLKTGTFERIHRSRFSLIAAVCSYPLAFIPFVMLTFFGRTPGQAARDKIAEYEAAANRPAFMTARWNAYRASVSYARRSLLMRRKCGRLHTNACGDFTLMSRKNWIKAGGYMEFTGFPMNIDGLLCHAAQLAGAREDVLQDPARVYHIEHGDGSGYAEYAPEKLWRRLEDAGIPRITSDQYAEMLVAMAEGQTTGENNDDWGFAGETLPESSPLEPAADS